MSGNRKSCLSEEDLVKVARKKGRGEGRCIPLGSGARVLPICNQEDSIPSEGHHHSALDDAEADTASPKKGRSKEEETG